MPRARGIPRRANLRIQLRGRPATSTESSWAVGCGGESGEVIAAFNGHTWGGCCVSRSSMGARVAARPRSRPGVGAGRRSRSEAQRLRTSGPVNAHLPGAGVLRTAGLREAGCHSRPAQGARERHLRQVREGSECLGGRRRLVSSGLDLVTVGRRKTRRTPDGLSAACEFGDASLLRAVE